MKNILKNKLLLISIILITIITLTGVVNAASVTMNLTSSSKLKAGDTVQIVLKISNIDAGNGIDAIEGAFEYDKNVFDQVTQNSFEGINEWNIGMYATETQRFTLTRSSKVNMASDVLRVTLKVKENINVDSTTLRFYEVKASGGAVSDGGTGDIEIREVNIKIQKDTTIQNPVVNEVTTNETVNTIVNETKTNLVTNQIKDNGNTTGGKLPQTGENTASIIAGISIIAVIAIIAFIKYRNLDIK